MKWVRIRRQDECGKDAVSLDFEEAVREVGRENRRCSEMGHEDRQRGRVNQDPVKTQRL